MSEQSYSLVVLYQCPEQYQGVHFFRVPSNHPNLPGLRLAANNKVILNFNHASKEDEEAILNTFYPKECEEPCVFESFRVDSWHIQEPVNETIMIGIGLLYKR